ncbi:MAG: CDP-alcohol phosphatidyltransferase family protein, partial [Candidatus Binataceae bacterium]
FVIPSEPSAREAMRNLREAIYFDQLLLHAPLSREVVARNPLPRPSGIHLRRPRPAAHATPNLFRAVSRNRPRPVAYGSMLDSVLGAAPQVKRVQSAAARMLAEFGITANQATAAAAITGLIAGFGFAAGDRDFGLAMMLLSALMDALDGTLAREFSRPTALGGVFDLSADRLVEAAVIVGIAWRRPELYLPALILVCSWYLNITIFLAVGAALERRGSKLIDYPPGILERSEALIFFTILAFVRSAGPALCYVFTALEIATGVQRLAFGIRNLRPG